MEDHSGHRQRMFEKMKKGALVEHEYLEVLLFFVYPRRNTNDIAHRLISRFGSIRDVLSASPKEWEEVEGVGTAASRFLEVVSHCCQQFVPVQEKWFPAKYEEDSFYSFLKERYVKSHDYEHLCVYCMDEESRLFHKREFSAFEKDTVMIDSEAIADYLSEVKPSGVVIAHNHPVSESSLPSEYDDEATERFRTICSVQNVLFCDHLICSDQGIYSYRKSDKIPDYEQVKKQRGQS